MIVTLHIYGTLQIYCFTWHYIIFRDYSRRRRVRQRSSQAKTFFGDETFTGQIHFLSPNHQFQSSPFKSLV